MKCCDATKTGRNKEQPSRTEQNTSCSGLENDVESKILGFMSNQCDSICGKCFASWHGKNLGSRVEDCHFGWALTKGLTFAATYGK